MPRLNNSNPKYRKHKASGQAIVTIHGQDVYLGPHGTAASRAAYDRAVAEWLIQGRQRPTVASSDLTVAELIRAFWTHAEKYYASTSGNRGELTSYRLALRIVRRSYGSAPIAAFGPIALKVVREKMIQAGWVRTYINSQLGRIKRMFKWGSENELVAAGSISNWRPSQACERARQTRRRESRCARYRTRTSRPCSHSCRPRWRP